MTFFTSIFFISSLCYIKHFIEIGCNHFFCISQKCREMEHFSNTIKLALLILINTFFIWDPNFLSRTYFIWNLKIVSTVNHRIFNFFSITLQLIIKLSLQSCFESFSKIMIYTWFKIVNKFFLHVPFCNHKIGLSKVLYV